MGCCCGLFRLLRCLVLVVGLCTSLAFNVKTRWPRRIPSVVLQAQPQGDPLREATGIRPSIHPVAINALAEALKLRAQNLPDMPLRRTDDLDPLAMTMAAGKIAQEAIRKRQETSEGDGMALTEEEQSVLAGRIIAVIRRFEDLEEELREKCGKIDWVDKYDEWGSFGVLQDETSTQEVDKRILDDPLFGVSRAECLLALFLEMVEGPGLRANGVTIPCMDADFLDSDRYDALFAESEDKEEETQQPDETEVRAEAAEEGPEKAVGDALRAANVIRPSLHPTTINAIAEALKVRAQNETSAPLREFHQQVEMFDIQLTAGKIAEQAVTQRQKTSENDGMQLTDDEARTVAGRIVGVTMRMEDLEWELNHRCKQEAWIAKYSEWDNFGILKDESCVRTLDERILSDPLFAVNRAERLLALFLLNLEGPGLKAAGESVPGGSDVDFLEEDHCKIMLPKEPAQ